MKCKECKYCEEGGRQQAQRGRLGRKTYFCNHKEALENSDKVYNFVGFGDMTEESPLTLKTSKKWCPLKEVKDE